MNKYVFIAVVFCAFACERGTEEECLADPIVTEADLSSGATYDSLYAEKLGADEYGMHEYVIAFLKVGPNRDQPEEEQKELQRAHLDNIGRMADDGSLVLAGPFSKEGDLKGIYIFDVKTIEEAQELTRTDPAIEAGRLVMELHPWYGTAALMEVSEIHRRIAKIKI